MPVPTAALTLAPDDEPLADNPNPPAPTAPVVAEHPVTLIPLDGPLADPQAEISGLAWHDDTLVLLPQYPDRFGEQGQGMLFALEKAEILSYLGGQTTSPLQPRPIPFFTTGLEEHIPGFEGFESIAFAGERIYLTIESSPNGMLGYLVSGWYEDNLDAIYIDSDHLAAIQPQADIPNLSDETLVVFGRMLITLYEANGASVNPSPIAQLFTQDLELIIKLAFPNIEYRITDATPANETGRFWAINTFYTGDDLLIPSTDPLVESYGEGSTHQQSPVVERLLEFQFTEQGITLSGTPPVQLELAPDGLTRNWEGIARLDDLGFLLATDLHPQTLFAFVPLQP